MLPLDQLTPEQRELIATVPPERRDAVIAALLGVAPNVIHANQSQGMVNRPTGPVTQTYHNTYLTPPDPTATTPEALQRSYLCRLLDEARYHTLRGIGLPTRADADAQLDLAQVYTALLTTSRQDEDTRRWPQPEREGKTAPPVSALNLLNRQRKLVLLGEPGSGKSTFVNFVSLCLAGERLGDPAANLAALCAPLPSRQDDDDDDGDEKPQAQAWEHGPLLPLRVVLRDFAARGLPPIGQPASAKHLQAFIAAELDAAGLAAYAPMLSKHLHEQGGVLLLDGLDEVPEADRRRAQIIQAIQDCAKTWSHCRFLVTCRTYAYQDVHWRLPGFDTAVITELSDGQIEHYVQRYYHAIQGFVKLPPEAAEVRAQSLNREIMRRERLHELAKRPLLLALIARLDAENNGQLPEQREELYDETVKLLIDQWERGKDVMDAQGRLLHQPSLSEYLKTDAKAMRQLLNRLAYEAHTKQPELRGTADVPEADLLQGLFGIAQPTSANPVQLESHLRERAGLLLPRGELKQTHVYTFPHRTLQEYLAACHLTDDDFPDKVARLARSDPNRWREVALLAGAKAGRGALGNVWNLAESLYGDDDEHNGGQDGGHYGALIAGQLLSENIIKPGQTSSPNQRKLAEVRERLVQGLGSRLPATERALAGNTLDKLGDPRFYDSSGLGLPKDDWLGFVPVAKGPFEMGDNNGYEAEKPQHTCHVISQDYYMARFTVTVAQWRMYCVAVGVTPADKDSLIGVGNHPVVWVGWREALTYTRWLSQAILNSSVLKDTAVGRLLASGQWQITLPSEAEWEKAARGTDGRPYPWPGDFDPEFANTADTKLGSTSSVGAFGLGRSPSGCEDMSGNVWEWTRSLWGKDVSKPTHTYPYENVKNRENTSVGDDIYVVVRGGAFNLNERDVRCAYRLRDQPLNRLNLIGFRCLLSPLSLRSEASDL